jgi:hypothetical protein
MGKNVTTSSSNGDVSRRGFIALGTLGLAGIGLAACSPAESPKAGVSGAGPAAGNAPDSFDKETGRLCENRP